MRTYDCDCCGRKCSRIHRLVAYGIETIACDDCIEYDYAAYDEPRDALLDAIDAGDLDCDGNAIPYPKYRGV